MYIVSEWKDACKCEVKVQANASVYIELMNGGSIHIGENVGNGRLWKVRNAYIGGSVEYVMNGGSIHLDICIVLICLPMR